MTGSRPLYQVAQIRAIEQRAMAALPPGTLMQRAGLCAAEAALRLLGRLGPGAGTAPVLVLAGPGNNGGDALEAAHHLARAGRQVSILMFSDATKLTPDAALAYARARSSAARFEDPSQPGLPGSTRWSMVIDGLFGIGLTRPIKEALRTLVETVNAMRCPVLALDVPSGLDADTGAIVGPAGVALRACRTITFIGNKPGLHTGYGRDYAGEVEVASLGIDPSHFPPAQAWLADCTLFADALKRRPHASHKGSFGDVAILGGAQGMAGAPILAARAALNCGAGRVFAGFIDQGPAYDSGQPELMCRPADTLDLAAATLVAGPGMGTSRAAHDLLAAALGSAAPLVLDADALNLLAVEPGLRQKLAQRRAATLLTPHPLEAARLLGTSSDAIQADRPGAARMLAARFNAIAVLKGSGTIIARPSGDIVINRTGNPGLATAGSGDVLSGICGALLAQRWPQWQAAIAAVWLHGSAADALVENGTGPVGITAGELIPCARAILNKLIEQHDPTPAR